MNDGLKKFINDLGVLCEQWLVVYNHFTSRGLDEKTALMHTREFTAALIAGTQMGKGGNNDQA